MGARIWQCLGRAACAVLCVAIASACGRPAPAQPEAPPPSQPQPAPPEPAIAYPQEETLSAGAYRTCAITVAGAAYCWGSNHDGALGDGTTTNRWVPTAVVGELTFRQITTAGDQTCGLTTEGALYCWGQDYGPAPTRVAPELTFSQASLTDNREICGLVRDGSVYCWLGGDPQRVDGGIRFMQIALRRWAGRHCGLEVGGGAYCWISPLKPIAVRGHLTFTAIATSWDECCALTLEGKAYCWRDWNEPALVSSSLRFKHLGTSSTSEWVLGITESGDVYSFRTHSAPWLVQRGFTRAAQGHSHACGLTAAGEAYCWGTSSFGEAGSESAIPGDTPNRVAGGLRFR